MRKTYKSAPSARTKEYRQGVRDNRSISFYDKQIAAYKKRVKELENEHKIIKTKISKIWEKYNALLTEGGIIEDSIEKIKLKIKSTETRKSDREFENGQKFFNRGYKTLKNNEGEEFNDYNTKYMSPYAIGNTATYRRKESSKRRSKK